MKKLSLVYIFCVFASLAFAQNTELSPFYKAKLTDAYELEKLKADIENGFAEKSFELIGDYQPENRDGLSVLCFSRKDLSELCLKSKDRGALAAVVRVGIVHKGKETTLSLLNPNYVFCAYLANYESDKTQLKQIATDAKEALAKLGGKLELFGGKLSEQAIKKYHYKVMMPTFTKPVELNTFASFEEGLATIRKNLKSGKGNTSLVYEQVFAGEKVAVFGIGLFDAEDGEAYFLPIIGEDQIAAMPYEIILQGNEVTMLHGKYRIALYWPDVTMGNFMRISSTPNDIKGFLKEVTL